MASMSVRKGAVAAGVLAAAGLAARWVRCQFDQFDQSDRSGGAVAYISDPPPPHHHHIDPLLEDAISDPPPPTRG